MNANNTLKGLRCISINRCSDIKQVEESLPQQRKALLNFIEKNGMCLIQEVEAPAVSASVEDHKRIIYDLRDKKIAGRLNFDVLLFYDWHRFTRTGKRDGNRILADLADEDIVVVTVKDGLLVGKEGEYRTDQSLRDSEAYAETVAGNVSRGIDDAIRNGELPHCSITPYGTDKCYLSESGQPLFILRPLGPDKRVMLDPDTRQVIKVLNHSAKDRAVTKQSDQRIVLVKGPPEEVKIVNEIFTMRYRDGWGSGRICRSLNERGVPSPQGGTWTRTTIERMYVNRLYLGTGHANTVTNGVYATRNEFMPIMLPMRRTPGRRKDGQGRRKNIPVIPRDEKEHLPVLYPALVDILDEPLRELVREALDRRKSLPARRSKGGRRYVQSTYILRGILRTKQPDLPMVGVSSIGWQKKVYRYYSLHEAANKPGSDEKLSARLPADLAEHQVLAALAETLRGADAIRSGIREYIERRLEQDRKALDPLPALIAEKERLQKEYLTITQVLGKHGQALLAKRVAELEALLDEIDLKMGAAPSPAQFRADDAEAIAEAVVSQCSEIANLLEDRSSHSLRKVLEVFVPRATFDLDTKEVEVEIAVPSWAISVEPRLLDEVRRTPRPVDGSGHHTHEEDGVSLASYKCRHMRISRSPCLSCNRLALAA